MAIIAQALALIHFAGAGNDPLGSDPCCTPPEVSAICWLAATGGSASAALQAAVGCPGAQLVRVPKRDTAWVLETTLYLNQSHQTVHLEPGVLVQAQRGQFHHSGAQLVVIDNVENVTLSGHGATLQK